MPLRARDISKSKKANRACAASREAALPHAPDVLTFESVPGRKGFFFCGDVEGLLGSTADELLERPWHELIHPEDRAGYLRAPAGTEGHPRRLEYRFCRKDGSAVWLREISQVTQDRSKKRLSGYLRDITREQDLWMQFQHLQKKQVLGELASVIAHDFNNLLTIFNGYTEMLQDEIPEEHHQRAYLEEMASAVERARELTRHLLDFGHVHPAPPGPTQLGPFLLDLCRILRRLVTEDTAWDATILDEKGWVPAAPRQIETLCLNLILNACAAMSQGGKLTLTLNSALIRRSDPRVKEGWVPGRYLRLTVADTGSGIEQANLGKIFDPFFTTKPPGCGSGLGLAVCKGIVEECGGKMTVESTPGKGSAFHVFLPCVKAPAFPDGNDGEAVGVPKHRKPPRGNGEMILVVEDGAGPRQLLTASLRQLGYRAICASHGKEALRILKKEPEIALVISDWIMPLMGGVELAQRLREQKSQTPMVLISGYASTPKEITDPFLQPIYFMTKPLTLSGLAHKLRELLDA